jgi:poly(hydroxyalkanoate) depolymerase family esterase
MRNISDTIERLSAFRRHSGASPMADARNRLRDLADFGANPGALRARLYLPQALGRNAPLVVVLHGCTQTAAGYDHGAGWSQLADRQGFALLFPEQQRSNNPNLCFNWFEPSDIRRDGGEALSIRNMIEAMISANDIDRRRIFVTGLSAGGAMAAVMLATYPELFAGGAIIAGLPYGCASSAPEAFDRMRGHGGPSEKGSQDQLRRASGHAGPWPTVSVWHGAADRTVDPSNAAAIVAQWRSVHGVQERPAYSESGAGYVKRAWLADDGREAIEEYAVAGMGHGTPLKTGGPNGLGAAGPFMLEVGVSSTEQIARDWGLISRVEDRRETERALVVSDAEAPAAPAAQSAQDKADEPRKPSPSSGSMHGIRKTIEDALRAAGLMK